MEKGRIFDRVGDETDTFRGYVFSPNCTFPECLLIIKNKRRFRSKKRRGALVLMKGRLIVTCQKEKGDKAHDKQKRFLIFAIKMAIA